MKESTKDQVLRIAKELGLSYTYSAHDDTITMSVKAQTKEESNTISEMTKRIDDLKARNNKLLSENGLLSTKCYELEKQLQAIRETFN